MIKDNLFFKLFHKGSLNFKLHFDYYNFTHSNNLIVK